MNSQISNLLLWAFVAALAVVCIQSTTAEDTSRLKRIFCNFDGCGNGHYGKRAGASGNPILDRILQSYNDKSTRFADEDNAGLNLDDKQVSPDLAEESVLWDAIMEKLRSRQSLIKKRHAPMQ